METLFPVLIVRGAFSGLIDLVSIDDASSQLPQPLGKSQEVRRQTTAPAGGARSRISG
jgi:hypothetical protein